MPYYQPETAYRIFARTLASLDLATGGVRLTTQYSTTGPPTVSDVTNAPPILPPIQCYVDAAPLNLRCTPSQIAALQNGTAIVDPLGIVVSPAQ